MTCNRQKTKGSAKDILWCRSASKLLNFKKSTVKDQLGAKAVGVGRPIIWGLAVDGEQGASSILSILRKDFELAMRLCGCTAVEEIKNALIG